MHLTSVFQFVCPDPKGSKLKNQHVPLPAGRQALGIKGKNRLIFLIWESRIKLFISSYYNKYFLIPLHFRWLY
jgi:hypothetical protein